MLDVNMMRIFLLFAHCPSYVPAWHVVFANLLCFPRSSMSPRVANHHPDITIEPTRATCKSIMLHSSTLRITDYNHYQCLSEVDNAVPCALQKSRLGLE
jgi:hypothetical protein